MTLKLSPEELVSVQICLSNVIRELEAKNKDNNGGLGIPVHVWTQAKLSCHTRIYIVYSEYYMHVYNNYLQAGSPLDKFCYFIGAHCCLSSDGAHFSVDLMYKITVRAKC